MVHRVTLKVRFVILSYTCLVYELLHNNNGYHLLSACFCVNVRTRSQESDLNRYFGAFTAFFVVVICLVVAVVLFVVAWVVFGACFTNG